MPEPSLALRDYDPARDAAWAGERLLGGFAGRFQVRRGASIDVLALPGWVAERAGERVGLLTYAREGSGCEVAFVGVVEPRRGVGSALLARLLEGARDGERLWLVTTNDNVGAVRFYERHGFAVCAVRAGAVDEARRALKPEIPLVGEGGVPIRDEVEMEARVGSRAGAGPRPPDRGGGAARG